MSEIRPLRVYADVSLGRQRSPQHEEGPHMVPYLRAANVKDGLLDLTDVKEMNFSPAEQAIFGLRPGDVLVTEGSGSLGAVGASAVWSGEISGTVCFQNTLLRLRPRPGTDPRYLAWWCRYAFADGLFASVTTGANIYHVSAERVRAIPVVYVPFPRQQAIGDFLEAEIARIDDLIARKHEMLTLLGERFESLAFEAVTRSPRECRLKPSGLDWVRQIPIHWSTPTVSANFQVQLGKMLSPDATDGADQFPYLRNVNIQWDRVDVDDLATMHFGREERRKYELREGDLLVCEGGEVGRSAIWTGEVEQCYFQKAIHRIRTRTNGHIRYLMYCLRVAARQGVFSAEGNLSTIAHLTREQLNALRLPWPDDDEQMDIVERIDSAATRLHAVKAVLDRQVGLLRERRGALITAAVTGELEIPGVAA